MGIYLFWEPSYGRAPERTGKVAPRKSGLTSDVGAAMVASVKPNFVPRRGLRIYRAFGVVGALLGLLVGTELPFRSWTQWTSSPLAHSTQMP